MIFYANSEGTNPLKNNSVSADFKRHFGHLFLPLIYRIMKLSEKHTNLPQLNYEILHNMVLQNSL